MNARSLRGGPFLSVLLLVVGPGAGVAAAQAPSASPPAAGNAVAVRMESERQELLINLTGGLPGRWIVCADACGSQTPSMTLLRASAGGGRFSWHVEGDADATRALERMRYTATTGPGADDAVVVLTSVDPWQGIHLIHRYALDGDGHALRMSLQVPAGTRLRLEGGDDLVPEPMPGLGSYYNGVRGIAVDAAGQSVLADDPGADPAANVEAAIGPGRWSGLRSRFWALLVSAGSETPVALGMAEQDRPVVVAGGGTDRGKILDLTVYGGPVERGALTAVGPELAGLLYPALWDWLRALSFAMGRLLEFWHGLVGHWAVAIVLLSVSVKLLMWPLTHVAERWQAQVNRVQSRLEPELREIRRRYRGEEAHERTLAVYRSHGVSPLHTLKSLAGFLIQIPVFIAAFDMLGENFHLHQASFLWIDDLAQPDRLLPLPAAVPFFGAHLNFLPVLMTVLTIAAARLQEDPSLSPALRTGQRRRLYGMALVFFVLLYTFPAGMVLYWTTNNALHLGRILVGRWVGDGLAKWRTAPPAAPGPTISDPAAGDAPR